MLKNQILKVVDDLLPKTSNDRVTFAWNGLTHLSFTSPTKDRLYVKILNVLKNADRPLTISDIYSKIPGTVQHKNISGSKNAKDGMGYERTYRLRWANHAILGCTVDGGYVEKCPKHCYKITQKGLNYLTAFGL